MLGKWGLWRKDLGWLDCFGEYILYDYKSQADEVVRGAWEVRQFGVDFV